MPVLFRMAANGAPAKLDLHGDVGWDITVPAVAKSLKEAAGQPLTVSINSFGGAAFEGIAIHNMLARHAAPVTVVVEGIAASAGSIIAMAGQRIIMPENAMMMIHRASGLSWGTAGDARDVADVLDKIDEAAASTYAARSGLPQADIIAMMDAETWMTAQEAKDKGFATEVAPAAEITLSADRLARFANVPRALMAAASPTPAPVSAAAHTPAPPAPSKEPTMPEANTASTPGTGVAPAPATLAQLQAIQAQGKGILGADWIVAQLQAGATETAATADAFRLAAAAASSKEADRAVNELAAQAPQLNVGPRTQIVTDPKAEAQKAELLVNVLQHMAGQPVKLMAGAEEFRGFSLSDLARHCLEANGVSTRRMTKAEMARAALTRNFSMSVPGHSSSDFPNLLANTASKSLRDAYQLAPRTFAGWATQKSLPDFKTFREIALSGAPQLAAVPETGAVSYGAIGEGAETWGLTRYGRAVAVTYVAIVNDDLSGFTRIPQMFGAEAAALENATVWGIINTNANLADGGALFNATATTSTGGHANLAAGGSSAMTNDASGIAAVGALQKLMRLQRAPTVGGVAGRPLNLAGRTLAVPTALESIALSLFSQSVVPATTGALNPWRGTFEIVVEPLLDATSATAFYLFADPARVDTVSYGYLQGENGPMITSNVDFDTDGVAIKCMHNFGAKAIDFRGMAKSAGA